MRDVSIYRWGEKMNMAVVPAKNEQGRIGKVLGMLSKTSVQQIIVVVNGSRDNTMQEVKSLKMPNVNILYFRKELGIDIPRAVGAYKAFRCGATSVVFVDGDMIGDIFANINELLFAVNSKKIDLALTNCYPDITYSNELTEQIMIFRALLNINLGLYHKIDIATPSHGPHAVSRKLLEITNFRDFAVPPVILALAARNKLSIDIATTIPQNKLGSKVKNYAHSRKIADTIIGDSLEALCYFKGLPRQRHYLSREFQGYNLCRRFDLLERFMNTC